MSPAPAIPAFSLTLPIHDFIYLVALFILGAYVVYTAVLYYHWQTYATDGKVQNFTLALYFLSTLPLLIIMGITAFII